MLVRSLSLQHLHFGRECKWTRISEARHLEDEEEQASGLASERVNVTSDMRAGWLGGAEDETAEEKK